MNNIKEIAVYANGDSLSPKTWSNVPYYFCQQLEKREIIVDRVNFKVDINTIPSIIVRAYAKAKKFLIERKYGFKTNYKFNKTNYYFNSVEENIKKGQNKFKNVDIDVIFDFTHCLKRKDIPIVMISDFTIEYRILNKYKRKPISIENKLIKYQNSNLEKADLIICIFPDAYELLKTHYKEKVYYLGYFINSPYIYEDNIEERYKSNSIMFVGRDLYVPGLIKLINAVNYLESKNNFVIKINVIGIERDEISQDIDCSCCDFYGYLDKENHNDNEKFEYILKSSRIIANPTDEWNGFSSLLEGAYFGLPIYASTNNETKKFFGESEFFFKCESSKETKDIAQDLYKLFNLNKEEYRVISNAAHNFTKNYTWDKYVEKFLDLVKTKL